MSLTKEFNQFAGKIVSLSEFTALIKQAGFDPEMSPPAASLTRKIKKADDAGQFSEVEALMEDIKSSMYLTPEAAAEIEKLVLQAEDKEIAIATLNDALKTHTADDMYIRIQPSVKMVSWAYDDKKIVDAFIKAAEDCADHRNKAGVDLVQMEQILTNIATKSEKNSGCK